MLEIKISTMNILSKFSTNADIGEDDLNLCRGMKNRSEYLSLDKVKM